MFEETGACLQPQQGLRLLPEAGCGSNRPFHNQSFLEEMKMCATDDEVDSTPSDSPLPHASTFNMLKVLAKVRSG